MLKNEYRRACLSLSQKAFAVRDRVFRIGRILCVSAFKPLRRVPVGCSRYFREFEKELCRESMLTELCRRFSHAQMILLRGLEIHDSPKHQERFLLAALLV